MAKKKSCFGFLNRASSRSWKVFLPRHSDYSPSFSSFIPPPLSSQFSSTCTAAPHWQPQTAHWCLSRLPRFWRRWKTRREARSAPLIRPRRWWDALRSTCWSTCPSLWWCARERGPSSACCSCWAPCGWVTPSTSSRGGRLLLIQPTLEL